MAGAVYYIPGNTNDDDDQFLRLAKGRLNIGLGQPTGTPPETTALVIGPGVDPRPAFERARALRFVQLTTCDNPYLDALDLDRKSVRVASISPAVADEVASHTIGLIVAARKLPGSAGIIGPEKVSVMASDASTLSGLQVGIIGLGAVGAAVAKRLAKTGARLVYSDLRTAPRKHTEGLGIRRMTLDLLLTKSDVIVVAARWGPTANPLIGRRELRLPDPGAVVINAADSRLVEIEALTDVLASGRIRGAGLGITVDNHLAGLPNVVSSPIEMSAVTSASAAELVVSNLESFVNDESISGLIEPIDYAPVGDPAFWSTRLYPRQTI